jgi:hypothetical protein
MFSLHLLQNAAGARYSTLRRLGATAGYTVTASKTLIITRATYISNSAGTYFTLGYSDADLGLSAVADGANPIDLDPAAFGAAGFMTLLTANTFYTLDTHYEFPAGKYPRAATPGGSAYIFGELFGHEL